MSEPQGQKTPKYKRQIGLKKVFKTDKVVLICTCPECKRKENGIAYILDGKEHYGVKLDHLRNLKQHDCFELLAEIFLPMIKAKIIGWWGVGTILALRGEAKFCLSLSEGQVAYVQEFSNNPEIMKELRRNLSAGMKMWPELRATVEMVLPKPLRLGGVVRHLEVSPEEPQSPQLVQPQTKKARIMDEASHNQGETEDFLAQQHFLQLCCDKELRDRVRRALISFSEHNIFPIKHFSVDGVIFIHGGRLYSVRWMACIPLGYLLIEDWELENSLRRANCVTEVSGVVSRKELYAQQKQPKEGSGLQQQEVGIPYIFSVQIGGQVYLVAEMLCSSMRETLDESDGCQQGTQTRLTFCFWDLRCYLP